MTKAGFRAREAVVTVQTEAKRDGSLHPASTVHHACEILFRLCANTDPQRDSSFTKGPSDVLDHATSEIASGSKLGIDATKKIHGEGFKRPWPPLIKMDAAVKAKVEKILNQK